MLQSGTQNVLLFKKIKRKKKFIDQNMMAGSSKGQLLPKGIGIKGDPAQVVPSPRAHRPTGAKHGRQSYGQVAGSINSAKSRSIVNAGDPIRNKRRWGQGNGCKQTQLQNSLDRDREPWVELK